ncbi:MAG: galactose mutarotase [Acidobacteria bacterium]|nr:galactose mutarotase [Acidobacteriota bacterium]
MQKAEWGQVGESPVFLYTLTNRQGLKAKVTNYGTILTEMHVPDRQGRMADITLGFDKLADYLPRHPYFGCICGRVVNRIFNARFTLDGREYALTKNYGEHHLHGGDQGFDRKVWTVAGESESDNGASVKMTYTSPDGEEGYPGNLTTTATYTLADDNTLRFEMEAETDAPTLVNLAHHAYWNLAGHDAASVLGHELQLNAPSYTVSDGLGVPTGEIGPVEGTRFDFTKPKTLGADIGNISADAKDQREGYDVNFVLDGSPGQLRRAARVREPVSGRTLEVHTTAPGVQLYTGNYLDGSFQGKGGIAYQKQTGFCLETQHFPDSITKEGQPGWHSIILRPGQTYRHTVVFTFGVE